MTTNLQLCSHLAGNNRQALGYIDGTYFCAPCFADKVETLLSTVAPSAIPHLCSFSECHHFENHETCSVCFSGVIGALTLAWSFAKLQGDSRAANRLGSTIRELRRANGRVHFIEG